MKFKIMYITFILSTIIVSGCSSMITTQQFKPMVEPEDGSRVRLRIISDSAVLAIPERDCLDWGAQGSGTAFATGGLGSKGYQGRSLGMPDPQTSASSTMGEMYIAADKPITLHYIYGANPSCTNPVWFIPKEGKDYEAIMKFDANTRTCYAIITTLGQVRESVKVNHAQVCK